MEPSTEGDPIALYLVTGGAGFIGSHVVDEIVARGHRVRVLDDFFSGRIENLEDAVAATGGPVRPSQQQREAARLQIVEGDIRDRTTCDDACRGVDKVIHLAAVPSVPRSIADPFTTNAVNVTGTLNVLVAARDAGVGRVVCISSSSVYGDEPGIPKVETMMTRPIAPYAVSKLACEHYARSVFRVYGLETVSIRYFNVFGPRQDPKSEYAAVIPKFIMALLAGESPTVFGDGENSRDFTYVKNAVEGTLLAADVPASGLTGEGIAGEAFNIACGGRYTLNQLLTELAEVTGVDTPATYLPDRKGDIPHSQADVQKARRLLGFEPSVGFTEGIAQTVAWYREKVAKG